MEIKLFGRKGKEIWRPKFAPYLPLKDKLPFEIRNDAYGERPITEEELRLYRQKLKRKERKRKIKKIFKQK